MSRSLPPSCIVAFLATLGVVGVLEAVGQGGDGPAAGLLVVMTLPLPLLIAVVWGWALLAAGRADRVVGFAAGALAIALIFGSGLVILQVAGHAAAGIIAGLALGRNWRVDVALLGCCLVWLPGIMLTVNEVPVREQLALLRQDILEMRTAQFPESADQEERDKALAAEEGRIDQALDLAGRIYPLVIGIGLLGEAAVTLVLVWLAGRTLGRTRIGWRFGSFSRCRLPFYLVWVLVVGLGLMLTRRPELSGWGLNLALLAALILSIQGIAVQVFVIGRMLSPVGRLVFWTLMGVFFPPLVVASGVILGVADQWLDFRRLDRPENDEDEKVV